MVILMKNIKTIVMLIACMVFPIVCSAAVDIFDVPDTISVNDYSVVMNEETKSYIRGCNDALMASTESKIIIVTVPTTGEEAIDEYATRLYNTWGVKNAGNNTSTFVLLATDDMEYWVIVGENLKSAFTADMVNSILLEYMEPDFAVRNFDQAIRKTYNAINSWYSKTFHTPAKPQPSEQGDSKKSNNGLIILGIIAKVLLYAFIALVVVVILYAYLKREIRLRQMARRRRLEKKEKFSYSQAPKNDDINV